MVFSTLYQVGNFWPMKNNADPLAGWHLSEVLAHTTAASRDIIGGLFYLVQHTLWQFCGQVASRGINFQIFHQDATVLPTFLSDAQFDRIEVKFYVPSPRGLKY